MSIAILANKKEQSALQCWSSIQRNYGINVCTLMSMMSDKLMPSVCEVRYAPKKLNSVVL